MNSPSTWRVEIKIKKFTRRAPVSVLDADIKADDSKAVFGKKFKFHNDLFQKYNDLEVDRSSWHTGKDVQRAPRTYVSKENRREFHKIKWQT